MRDVLIERGKQYGAFLLHAQLTQALKGLCENHLANCNDQNLSPIEKEGLAMILHKIGRICNGNPHLKDSWVDIAGYAQLVADTLEEPNGEN